MFLLKACSSSHSCCLGLAGLTNAGLVLSPERALSQGVQGTRTHTVPSSCFSFTFNTTRERERGGGQRREKWCAKKKNRKRERGGQNPWREKQMNKNVKTTRKRAAVFWKRSIKETSSLLEWNHVRDTAETSAPAHSGKVKQHYTVSVRRKAVTDKSTVPLT